MASLPPFPTAQHLLTLGLFVFGMDTAAYDSLRRQVEWRHGKSERHQARSASQFLGLGDDTIEITGLLIPEMGGSYAALEKLEEMGDTGEEQPLMDGTGRVFGHFRILRLELEHLGVMAGGVPRAQGFSLSLERAADTQQAS